MLLERTRIETKSKHDSMEKLIGSHRLSDFSMDDYAKLVYTNFVFHSNLEYQISENLTETQKNALDFNSRKKVQSISKDLAELNLSLDNFKILTQPITDFHVALGWLYVGEGSMLGGKYIHQILSGNSEISKLTSFHFYKVYGSETGKLWKSFRKLVVEECQTENQQVLFAFGVNQAYDFFKEAFFNAENLLKNKSLVSL